MFKINDISSPTKLPLSGINFRDLNKRFGKNEDYIELQILNLNNEVLSIFNLNKNSSLFQIVETDTDGLTNEIKIDFAKALRTRGFEVGKYRIKLSILRTKILGGKPFNIKEISPSRRELRVVANNITNESFERAIKNYIAERDSSPFFKDFNLKFNNEEIIGINIILNNIVSKYEALIKLYEPLPQSISLIDKFTIVEDIIDPLFIDVDLQQDINIVETTSSIFLQPNFNIDTRNNNSIPSSYKNFNSILDYSVTSSYQNLLSKLENKEVPAIPYDYIRPTHSSSLDETYHFENFVHFGSATERLKNFQYKLGLIEIYDNQISNIDLITGNASSSKFTLNNRESINTKKQNIIKGFDGYEKFLYFTTGSNPYTWPKSGIVSGSFTLFPSTSSQAISWLGSEGYGSSVGSGQLQSASLFDNSNPYSLQRLIPNHIKEGEDNNFYLSFVDMIGQHFDHIWTHIKHITEVNDTHHVRGISKDLVWYQLKALGIDAFDQFENSNLIEYILGQGTTGSLFYDQPNKQTLVTASNAGSIAKGDITKEIWKRLYHNAPYLLKTKGTERGIRALMACYGLPSTILNIKEYGGSKPITGSFKNTDTENLYKTFTYEKSSLALKTVGAVPTTNPVKYLVKVPWASTNVGTTVKQKTIQLRIKPAVGNEGIALSLDVPNDGSSLKLELDKYEGNDISSSGDASTYGRLRLTTGTAFPATGGNILASSSLFPLYNGDFWNIYMARNKADGNLSFGAYQTNHLKNTFKVNKVHAIGAGSYNTTFGLNAGDGDSHLYAGTKGYEGSIQELRSNWGEILSDATLTKHSLEPFMYAGNSISSSFTNVVLRYPLGSTDEETFENHIPDTSLAATHFTASNNHAFIFEEVIEDHHLPTPDTVGKSMSSEKVRIDTGTIDEDILLPFAKGETSILDRQPQDFSDLGIHFSPTMEINEDIIYTLGAFRLDDFIGSPLPSAQTSSQYTDLKNIKDLYFKKVHHKYNYFDYIKLIQQVDHTLFKIIENWVPWKANTKTGLLIEPHYLERNKFARTLPKRSDSQTMTTGLHGVFNADVKGETIQELYTLNSSSAVTTNNLSPVRDSRGVRKDQGTNFTIDMFSNYQQDRDANFENNHSAQAPITPHSTIGTPKGYISHNSNILLGNATKGKTSRIYRRILRNGKEIDF